MDRRWLSFVFLFSTTCSDIPPNHDTAEQCGCVTAPVRLSPIGSPVQTTTSVGPCRDFRLDVAAFEDRPAASCGMPMSCPAMYTGINVQQAVDNPDVQAAIRAGSVRYGAGPELPEGGPVYRVEVGQANFEVAAPCAESPGCVAIPPGVQSLVDVLLAVNSQETIRTPCREMLGLSH
jgi:hypothetical protein